MEPENAPLEKEKHLPTTNFWIPCLFSGVATKYVSFGQTPSQSSNTYYPLLLQLQIEPVSPEEKGTQYLVRLIPRKLTISLEKLAFPKWNLSSNHHFSGTILVLGRVIFVCLSFLGACGYLILRHIHAGKWTTTSFFYPFHNISKYPPEFLVLCGRVHDKVCTVLVRENPNALPWLKEKHDI